MSQRPSDQLSIDRIARFWTAESDKVGFGAEDIAEDLIDAALRGEFQYSPKGDWRSPIPDEPLEELLPITDCQTSERSTWSSTIFPPTGAPANYDPRLAMLIETFDRDGNAINSSQLQTYVDARKTAPGATDRETRRIVASEIFLSVEGLRRWCDEPGFSEWAKLRGLSRPRFIDRASGDGPGQASPVDQEPEEVSTAEATAGESADLLILDPAGAPDPIIEETALFELEDLLPDAPSPSSPRKKASKPRRGRKKGSGSFADKDKPLLEVMKPLIAAGTSDWAAAMTVVGKAAGFGTDQSKAKRLVARYRESEKSNSV